MALEGIWALALTAASIGVVHTLSGPDHYLPLIAMAKAGRWSRARTVLVTLLAGLSHIASSLLVGLVGVGLGVAVARLNAFESYRSNIAAWALIAFGVLYLAWGLRRALTPKPHVHIHFHSDGTSHSHHHHHLGPHLHVHTASVKLHAGSHPHHHRENRLAVLGILAIFAFGASEPLIPILMYPTARKSAVGLAMVVGIYALATILAMLGGVLVGYSGVGMVKLKGLGRWSHAVAGCAMTACGIAIVYWGL